MSIVESALQKAEEDIFNHLGDGATYYPNSGDPVSCMVDVGKEGQNEPDGYALKARGEQTTIEGLIRILGKIPVPRKQNRAGETFVMTESRITWEVTGILESDDRFVTCSVKELK